MGIIIGKSGVGLGNGQVIEKKRKRKRKKKKVMLRKVFVSSVYSGIHWVFGLVGQN